MRTLIALLFLFLASTAHAGFVSSEGHHCDSSPCSDTDFTIANASGNDRIIIASCGIELQGNVTDMTLDGTSGTEITESDFASGSEYATLSLWYWLDSEAPASAGDYTVACTSSTYADVDIITAEYTGLEQQAPEDTDTTEGASVGSISDSTTTVTADAEIYSIVMCGQPRSFTGSDGLTKQTEVDNDSSSVADGTETGASSPGANTGGFSFDNTCNRASLITTAWEVVTVAAGRRVIFAN